MDGQTASLESPDSDSSNNMGMIVGIVGGVAGVAVLALICVTVMYFRTTRAARRGPITYKADVTTTNADTSGIDMKMAGSSSAATVTHVDLIAGQEASEQGGLDYL